jgi:subtilisin family serine protease
VLNMAGVRRAVLATFLCAAPLFAASAQASTGMLEREAAREALRHSARAAGGGGVVPLPLPEPPRASASSASSELARVARSNGPERLLIGARTHEDLDGLAARVRSLGGEPELFETIGALAASVPSGADAVAALRDDPRVAYIERDRTLRTAADPFDTIDPTFLPPPIKFTWAYDVVRAGEALATVGGGSARTVSVIDTGLDVNHPEFAGQVARVFDTSSGGADVTDIVGHGTFVSGLIAALDGNGRGGKGVAGTTKILAVRASLDGSFTVSDLISGIEFSIRRGVDVINLSLAGQGFTQTQARAFEAAFFNDVLPVAAAGNNAENGNPLEFPAAAIGGTQGGRGIGLSVAATKPDGSVASFSNHNAFVSVAAPGASTADCQHGVFSTLPASGGTEWDVPDSCSLVFSDGSARYAYGEGTSFAAPIVSGLAAVAWQAESRLASEQVADVMVRSATGGGWNEFTGAGIVDAKAAVDIAARYDVINPRARGKTRRRANRVKATVLRTQDRTDPGDELAGALTYGLLVSRNGGRSYQVAASRRRRPFSKTVRIRGTRKNVLVATACDGNGNCGVKVLGRFRRR